MVENFTFYNPVKIYFGKGQVAQLREEIPRNKKVLMTYGGGSIKSNGVYDQVMKALQGNEVIEFGGIEPNPQYDTLMRAVKLSRDLKIDFILAVGGGSVLDGTKFISAAIPFVGEPWDILAKNAAVDSAIPFGTVLTLPAAGSEMNCGAVISKKDTNDKLSFIREAVFPKFSILDPTFTYTLSERQTSNGIIDTFVHVTEQYITYPVNAVVQDRWSEGILLGLIENAPLVFRHPDDYKVRANLMWCSTSALNGLLLSGVPQDWATHLIGHEITALYGLDHGQTLAIVLPSLLHICRWMKRVKLLQYAERVWNITSGNDKERIDEAIRKTRDFFEGLNVKTSLSKYGIGSEAVPALLQQLERHNLIALGERRDITLKVSEQILKTCIDGVDL